MTAIAPLTISIIGASFEIYSRKHVKIVTIQKILLMQSGEEHHLAVLVHAEQSGQFTILEY